jgi:hypothetical protein
MVSVTAGEDTLQDRYHAGVILALREIQDLEFYSLGE